MGNEHWSFFCQDSRGFWVKVGVKYPNCCFLRQNTKRNLVNEGVFLGGVEFDYLFLYSVNFRR